MSNSQKFWRAVFFLLLLAALCGSFVFPITYVPANAAPQMQGTACVGTTIAQWTFENVTTPSTGAGTFSPGSGLTGPSYVSGNPGQAASFTNWTNKSPLDANDYVEFAVPTVGRSSIGLSFDYQASGTGPLVLEIHYSVDGTNYTLLGSSVTITRDGNFYSLTFDFSSITQLNDNANAKFRIYGYSSGGGGGTLRFDDATFTGTCLIAADTDTPTATASATNTGTPTGTGTATGTATATNTSSPSGTILINEVAWAGTSSQNSNDEWIELRNPGTSDINITGWRLYGDNNTLNQVGNPDITLSGTIPAGGFFLLERAQEATSVTANQVYSSGDLLNGGERLYLKDSNGNTVDTANLDGGAWPAGTAAVTATTQLSYASMERVGTTSAWVTYAGTVPIAFDRAGDPIKGTPGGQNWIATATITTITSDTPDPSLVNQNVTVSVTVIGGNTIPTGTVSITGANTNCTITLTNGSGSCTARFSSTGSKTLTATYSGDSSHPASNDTEPHTVSTTTTIRTATPSRLPTLAPPPPLVAINEFVPRPGHDWNLDGEVNVHDEYVEIINHGTIDVNLSGYSLDDEVNIGSTPYRLPAVTIRPGERIVFYGSETGLLLSDGGDGVRLLKPNGQLADAYNYTVARYPDQSYCRLPDNGGLDDWNQNCFPTPGLQNSLSGGSASPSSGMNQQLLCPIADTLPEDFVIAECAPYGNNIWRRAFWDATGWYGEKIIPKIQSRWDVFAD